MTDDKKPGPNLSMVTIPNIKEPEIREQDTWTAEFPPEIAEKLAQQDAARRALVEPTLPSFTAPKPAPVPVDALITDSLQAAIVLQRPPTISSLLGVPVQRIEEPSREPLSSLADRISPSSRPPPPLAPAPTEGKPGGSRALLWVVLVAVLAAGVAIGVLLR